MSTKKKRIIWLISFFALFVVAAGVTYVALNWNNLLQPGKQTISFPDAVSAEAEFKYLDFDDTYWETIKMKFPSADSAKELYELEVWANDYKYNHELLLAPWWLTVTYTLENGSEIERLYQKADWEEILIQFIKEHEQYITEKIPFKNK